MKFQRISILALAVIVSTVMLTGCSIFKREGRTRAKVLMVTGNYFDSRLICDLAQYRTLQPIIVVSPDEGGVPQIYFVPANEERTTQIAYNELGDFIDFINPRNIVIMGGSKFVPQDLIDIINTKSNNIIQLTNEDWEKNAISLGRLLKQDRLPKEYREYRDKCQYFEGE